MFKNACDVIVIIVSIIMEVEMFRNLIIVRNNKCGEDNRKLKKARVLIVVIIILYSIYGMVRNII